MHHQALGSVFARALPAPMRQHEQRMLPLITHAASHQHIVSNTPPRLDRPFQEESIAQSKHVKDPRHRSRHMRCCATGQLVAGTGPWDLHPTLKPR